MIDTPELIIASEQKVKPPSLIPEPNQREKQREQQKQEAMRSIDVILIDAIKSGRLSSAGNKEGFEDARSIYESDRGLQQVLEQHINTLFYALQGQTAEIFSGEQFPGKTVRQQTIIQEAVRRLLSQDPEKRIRIGNLLRPLLQDRHSIQVEINGIRWSHQPVSTLNTDQSIEAVIESGKNLTGKNVSYADVSKFLNAFEKKGGHLDQDGQPQNLISGFAAWNRFKEQFLSDQHNPETGRSYEESKTLRLMHLVITEQLLKKMIASIIKSPSFVIIRNGRSLQETRVQVMNHLGQGIETNHILLDPNYHNDPNNQIYFGAEFVGLVDSGAFIDVADKIRNILSSPNRNLQTYTGLISLLRESGMIFPIRGNNDRMNPTFTRRTIDEIVKSCMGQEYQDDVLQYLVSSKLLPSKERRILLGGSEPMERQLALPLPEQNGET